MECGTWHCSTGCVQGLVMGVATLALCTGQGLVHNWPLRCLTVLLYPAAWQISVNDCHPWESARHTGKSIGNTVLSCPMGQDKCTLHGYLQAMWGGVGTVVHCTFVQLSSMHRWIHLASPMVYRALLHLCQKTRLQKSRQGAKPKKK